MLIVDTGVLVAAADRTDRHHQRCTELIAAEPGSLVTTAMVIAECAYLIERELGTVAEASLYETINDGALVVENLTRTDWNRVHQLVTTYASLPLGGTDASVITIAERLGQRTIATLDHRHFAVIRPAHCDGFELTP